LNRESLNWFVLMRAGASQAKIPDSGHTSGDFKSITDPEVKLSHSKSLQTRRKKQRAKKDITAAAKAAERLAKGIGAATGVKKEKVKKEKAPKAEKVKTEKVKKVKLTKEELGRQDSEARAAARKGK